MDRQAREEVCSRLVGWAGFVPGPVGARGLIKPGPQQDMASTFQNKGSAFLGHRSFKNRMLVQMLSPGENSTCTHKYNCRELQKLWSLFVLKASDS